MARKSVAGIALMDVVVSLGLMFLMTVLVLNLFTSSSLVLQHAQQRQTALELARSQLEELRGQPFTSLQPGVQTRPEVLSQGVAYSTRCILTSAHSGELIVAQCKVEWLSGTQRREVSYASYITQHR